MSSMKNIKRKLVLRFLKKLKIELPYDPAVPLLGVHLKETKTELHDVCFINSINPIPRTVFDTHWQLNK